MRTFTSTLNAKQVQAIIAADAARMGNCGDRMTSKCAQELNSYGFAQKPASSSIEAEMEQSVCGFVGQNYWSFHGSSRAKGLVGRYQH